MKHFSFYTIIAVLLLQTAALRAQTTITTADLPYFCDFEDDAENANWVLNPAIDQINTDNAWTIGNALAYTGDNALYVSNDNGRTNLYNNTHNVLIAYRTISLDQGEYDIAYDWQGRGNGNNGYLKVVFDTRPDNSIECLGNSVEPTWVSLAVANCMGNLTQLNNSTGWQHVQSTIKVPRAAANSQDTRILFIWVNNDAAVDSSRTTIAIDNFQLAKSSTTGYPENIHVSTSLQTASLDWDGGADSYEILYRKKGDDEFTSISSSTSSLDLENIEYGAYEFWICGINGTDKTVYTIFPTVYLYETACFDALNMYNADFEYGDWENRTSGVVRNIEGTTRVDYGPANMYSRHTTHFDKTEIDPRTVTKVNNETIALHTVPDGEYGSVRIGNWDTGSEYESITFHHTVESDARSILLLHYAIVLENPNHTAIQQPRFTLDIKDKDGKSIDTNCASVDFHAPTDTEWQDPDVQAIWHRTYYNGTLINWQDWKTIGINLSDYIGEELFITFTSYDCSQGAHFGYAYFTLKCTRNDVDGIPWGDDAQAQLFSAPIGFEYAWYNKNDTLLEDLLSTEREFPVESSDTNTYICYATYPTNPECGFEYEASAKPHNPIAEIQYDWVPKNCVNGIFVRNACHVGLTNKITGDIEHRYDKRLDACRWTMPDGTTTDSLYYDGFFVPIPDEGDTLTYRLWTGIYVNDSLFQDSTECIIYVPAIGPTETPIENEICQGSEIEFPLNSGKKHTESGTYTDSLTSVITGCDSIVILHLNVIEPIRQTLYDTICHGQTYTYHGTPYTATGVYETTFDENVSTGCDSIVTLYLTIADRPTVTLQNGDACQGDELLFEADHSEWVDSFRIIIPDALDTIVPARLPDMQWIIPTADIRANNYTAQVISYMNWCEEYTDTIALNIHLSNQIVAAKFNDVFAILNAQYNGGYDFVSFQWYADGEPIEGATGSNYYNPDLSQDTEFTVQVQLADGTTLWICPFTFQGLKTDIEQTTTTAGDPQTARLIPLGTTLRLQNTEPTNYEWFTLTGQRITSGTTSSTADWIDTPQECGWYILRTQDTKSSTLQRIIIL